MDFLKIDGMFVKNIDSDPVNYAMVQAIEQVGRVMGKKTVAEFVENPAICKCLREIGVTFGQGYAILPPRPIEQLLEKGSLISLTSEALVNEQPRQPGVCGGPL